MTNGPRIFPNLEVIATFVALIAPKVDLVIVLLDEFEAERLVPALGEHVERNLTADTETQIQRRKFLFEHGDKVFSNVVLKVVLFVLVPLLAAAGSPHR
jgi:hypothetical protein